ncbi:MAG: methyltransferase domain-containing protein, partial [Candidatus Aenigmarchaeota archaeon]|nr:methyltransferase domain-containing protein [Candidatus Aenigmarchaeota archaeon]
MKLKLGELVLLFGKMSFLIKIEERTLSNQFGQIDMRELLEKKFGDTIKTHKGEEFHILKPGILDFLRFGAKRGPQVITPKDFATIISLTMPPRDAKIIEAGTGSGFQTMLFASLYPDAKIHTFERRKDFFDNSKKNFDALGLKNVFQKNQDFLEGTDEKDADLVILDMEDSENAVPIAHKALKIGGYLV